MSVTCHHFKLNTFQPTFSPCDILLHNSSLIHFNPVPIPPFIVSLHHPETETDSSSTSLSNYRPRLLLGIDSECLSGEIYINKESVYVEKSIAEKFKLSNYKDIQVNLIPPEEYHTLDLDSIELTFKDQYFGRSDMWRIKKGIK